MSLSVAVLTPVGPGHDQLVLRAHASVLEAWRRGHGPFSRISMTVFDDTSGTHGRSAARNRLMDENPADWHFLLDADDELAPHAFRHVDLNASATFGAVCFTWKWRHHRWARVSRRNRWPVTRETLFQHGADGTLSMGCFVRGDLGLRFDESLDNGEDFDFYMRLPDFTKRREPLVHIGYFEPSAGPPMSREDRQWQTVCAAVIDRYRPTSV